MELALDGSPDPKLAPSAKYDTFCSSAAIKFKEVLSDLGILD